MDDWYRKENGEIDREKVIDELERDFERIPDEETHAVGTFDREAVDCALKLLKAQEPKFVPDIAEAIIGCKPKVKVGHCPSCDVLIHETDKFCRKCGQAVKWE